MDGTIIQQGRFTSAGTAVTLSIRSDVDWMYVYNLTEAAAANGSHGVRYYWQRGLAVDNGFVDLRNAAATAIDMSTSSALAVPGFTLVDTSVNAPGPLQALTSISNANPPRVLVASTAGLNTGDVVRMINVTGAQQLGGMDFTITVADGTHFDLAFMPAIVAAAGPGSYRVIKYDPFFYPRRRYITSITRGATTTVQMSVRTTYTAGQSVYFNIPADFGMQELNNVYGTVLSVDTGTNSLVVDIDSNGFSAFAFPLTAAVPFTQAQVCPGGEDTAEALALGIDILGDATENRAIIGMRLGAGITSPAGSNNDVVYWVAGKSFSVSNS